MNRGDLAGLPAHARAEVQRQMNEKSKAKTAHAKPMMNKGEKLYAEFLRRRMLAGEVKSYLFEGDTLPLAYRCDYTPDFRVVLSDGRIEYHECKGKKGKSYYAREDARIKIKVAASLYPQFAFCVVWLDQGTWKRKDVPCVTINWTEHRGKDNR